MKLLIHDLRVLHLCFYNFLEGHVLFCHKTIEMFCFQPKISLRLSFIPCNHKISVFLKFLINDSSRICVSRLQTAEYIRAHVRRGGEGDRMRG